MERRHPHKSVPAGFGPFGGSELRSDPKFAMSRDQVDIAAETGLLASSHSIARVHQTDLSRDRLCQVQS